MELRKIEKGDGSFTIIMIVQTWDQEHGYIGVFSGDTREDAIDELTMWLSQEEFDFRFPVKMMLPMLATHPNIAIDTPDFHATWVTRKDDTIVG